MTRKHAVNFANYICRFEHLELLDLINEVIIPSFTSRYIRTYRESKYFFHDIRIENLIESNKGHEPAIFGRIVKDTVLRSHQVFQKGALVVSDEKIESSPSSIFVLLLKSHKLIFLKEYGRSPNIEAFRSTSLQFIKKHRIKFINDIYENQDPNKKKLNKGELDSMYPLPTLDILPLSNQEGLAEFVSRFKVLQSVTVKMIKPNNEINTDKFFKSARKISDNLGSNQSKISFKNKGGLAKEKAVSEIEPALDGNSSISFSGTDEHDDKLSGTNEDFKLTSYLELANESITAIAKKMFSLFQAALLDELIILPPHKLSESAKAKLESLKNSKA